MTTDQERPTELTREALYEAVWAEPMRRLAPKCGLSDVGLGKACRRLNIPVPPRGYWAKLAHGKRVEKPPLPPPADGHDVSVVFNAVTDEVSAVEERREARASRRREIEAALASAPAQIHPLAAEARRVIEAKKQPDDRYVYLNRPDPRITPARIPRATRIASKLLYALERLGCSLAIDTKSTWYWMAVRVERLEEECWLAIHEESDVIELKTNAWPRHKVVPNGRLLLLLREYQNRRTHTKWTETGDKPLEDLLGKIVGSVIRLTDLEHARTAERAEWSRRYEEERLIREEEERVRQLEVARRKKLEADAESWAQAEKIRAYIDAVERTGRPEHSAEWLVWARQHADRLDPTLRPRGETPDEAEEYDFD